ncbi:MAG: formylglycine-generating enzyme family protein [Thiotrichaceae bacterium]
MVEHQGAFRNVQTQDLWETLKHPRRRKELIDPSHRRLILLVTDCISKEWYDGKMVALLTELESQHPIALVQMLPQYMWRGTGLSQALRVNFRVTKPYTTNSQLTDDAAEFWLAEDIPQGIKMPVATLEAQSLGYWAKLVTQQGREWITGVRFEKPEKYPVESTASELATLSATDRVKRFSAMASPTAQKLVGYFAAMPLTLEIMRLIQFQMLPDSEQIHLAEIFLGGLLKHDNTIVTEYDFHEGVRELLLKSVSEYQKDQVFNKVSKFISERFGQCIDLCAWLQHPDIPVSEDRPFAQIAIKWLRQLGGKYKELADRIEQAQVSTVGKKRTETFEFDVITVDKTGKEIKRVRSKNYQEVYDLGNGVKLEMVYIPAGEFWMGSPEGEGYDDERPRHKVVITKPFYMGKYPVTQAQWQAVMGNNPSYFKGEKRPVETVSWNDAKEFCQKLSQRLGEKFDLPSEAQWE